MAFLYAIGQVETAGLVNAHVKFFEAWQHAFDPFADETVVLSELEPRGGGAFAESDVGNAANDGDFAA